jgi:hypothetical protein
MADTVEKVCAIPLTRNNQIIAVPSFRLLPPRKGHAGSRGLQATMDGAYCFAQVKLAAKLASPCPS